MTTNELLKIIHPSTCVTVAQNVNTCFGEQIICKRVGVEHGRLIYNKTEMLNMLVISLSVISGELEILVNEIPITSEEF